MILFPDFAPDRSGYALSASRSINNCQPVTDGWGPFPGLTTVSSALPLACKGAIAVRTISGSWATFVGTQQKLYTLDTSTALYGFTDYTRLSGGNYSVPNTDRWCFTPVGGRLIANNINDDIQYLDVNSGKLGPTVARRNEKLVKLLNAVGDLALGTYTDNTIDAFGDAYEYLMAMYAGSAG